MDEDEELVVVGQESELAQLANALCELAQQVDVTRDDDARIYLLQAMAGITYMLNPPKGEVHVIHGGKAKR
jgi:lipopolysaccharide biosynthesis regulator YciM